MKFHQILGNTETWDKLTKLISSESQFSRDSEYIGEIASLFQQRILWNSRSYVFKFETCSVAPLNRNEEDVFINKGIHVL